MSHIQSNNACREYWTSNVSSSGGNIKCPNETSHARVANADIGSQKSLHTLFDTYFGPTTCYWNLNKNILEAILEALSVAENINWNTVIFPKITVVQHVAPNMVDTISIKDSEALNRRKGITALSYQRKLSNRQGKKCKPTFLWKW